MSEVRVDSIMTTPVVTVSEADNLATIAAGLETYRFRHLPVVDGEVLVGMVSERDLLRASVSGLEQGAANKSRSEHLGDTFVRRLMVTDPDTVGPEATVSEAARRMVRGRFGCLPVVDSERRLLGILTEHDLLQVLAEE